MHGTARQVLSSESSQVPGSALYDESCPGAFRLHFICFFFHRFLAAMRGNNDNCLMVSVEQIHLSYWIDMYCNLSLQILLHLLTKYDINLPFWWGAGGIEKQKFSVMKQSLLDVGNSTNPPIVTCPTYLKDSIHNMRKPVR